MTPFGLLAPGLTRIGRGVAAEAAGRIAGFGARALLIHGRDAARARWLVDALAARGVEAEALACTGEPTVAMAQAAADRARGAAVVIGFGGGAAIDLAKAAAALAPASGDPLDYLEVVGAGRGLDADPLPVVAIPTLAGAGAEATRNAVLTAPDHARKVSLRDDRLIPRLALIDPALADGAPRDASLASGFDAAVQLVEPYLCTRANPLTDALVRQALPPALAALRALGEAGDAPAHRDALALAALCGGIALTNAGLGAVHGLAGPIGGRTGRGHGAICAALLPPILTLNEAAAPSPRFAEIRNWIAAAFGGAPDDDAATLARWMRAQGLPGLAAIGLAAADHAAIAREAAGSSSMKANPAPLGEAALREALAAAA